VLQPVEPAAAVDLRAAGRSRQLGPAAARAYRQPQLSDHGAFPLSDGGDRPGDPTVRHRIGHGETALLARTAFAGLPAGQECAGPEAIRVAARHVPGRL